METTRHIRTAEHQHLSRFVCDRYAMSKISPKRRMLYSIVQRLEEAVARRVDALINVSEKLESTFPKLPNNSII